MRILWIIIVFICGALLPLQTGFNARLGKSIGSPLYAALISFVVGVVAIALYIPFTKESVTWTGIKSASMLSLLGGGLIGPFFITASMLAMPRIGMALTFGLIMTGQVIIATLLDHFDILVGGQHSLNGWRILGIVFIIIGVIIVEKY